MLKTFNNKIIIFIVSRYLSYVVQFVNSLIIAFVLGPYYLGIWGFLSLVLQYLAFGNFGIDIALNVKLSTGDLSDAGKQSKISSNALTATLFTAILMFIIGGCLLVSGAAFFEKYMFSQYLLPVMLISCLNFFNVLFLNICRTYSLFAPISIFQTIVQLAQLPVLFFFRETELVWALLIAITTAHVLSLLVFIKKLPFRLRFDFDPELIRDLYKRGIALLSYALTFYILLLSTRSMVGYFFTVETMGLFTFSTNIATALIVGLSSLEFVLFPKMLNRLSSETITEKSQEMFREVRYIYMMTAFLVVIIGLLFYPAFLHYFKAYGNTIPVFTFLVICQVIISSGFGYSTLIISRGQELFLVVHGLIALSINLILSGSGAWFFKVDYSLMPMFLIFAFLYYDFQVIRKGRELLKMRTDFKSIIADLVPVRSLSALACIVLSVVTGHYYLFYILAMITFIIFNIKSYQLIKKYVQILFLKPTVINIES